MVTVFVSSGTDWHSEYSSSGDIGGEGLRVADTEVEPGALYKWVAQLTNSQGSTVIETSLTIRIPPDETMELSSDAALSALTLSEVHFDTFASGTTSYTASVANSVSQTTVTPTVNHPRASYVIKLGGVTDPDGVIPLRVGSNAITVSVTAEDGTTTRIYTVIVIREGSPVPESMMDRYDANNDDLIDRDEVFAAIDDYLFNNAITKGEVIEVINLYLFG